mmetsp:Transcript_4688/g.13357  ORF Transcript_4688/g.13357 Transcript_4688/m.13357 type:complete len:284 (-) Transcript_4688:186-1037(-)|eukprot:CAMPEP_0118862476 /NCGR_PEP_ID=MMETSP1163-20130328/7668_1 /TAXON_ID=124430 /ORGANISM="Phaeomonas parva, Strain CCMP2877" /LENGTH=283 /DNA_ID=CAMNT_0006796387 /DNA_START=196 /DNA_END=1047 /DNA_ORIENTATION=+
MEEQCRRIRATAAAAAVPLYVSLISGGVAGTTVDVVLFPLDTIKTRLQAPEGFMKSGGFNGLFKGVSAAAVGSAPGASLFFMSYETAKQNLEPRMESAPVAHMAAASLGEVAACVVRVPTEIIKQRMQANMFPTAQGALRNVLDTEGVLGLWRGYGSTVAREIPFSLIQFPLYEHLKKVWAASKASGELRPYESALCGSVSGAFSAAVTTPLDVVKTRLMLGADKAGVAYDGMASTFRRVVADEGAAALFKGVQPRVMWISIGGFFFFGAYEGTKASLMGMWH